MGFDCISTSLLPVFLLNLNLVKLLIILKVRLSVIAT